MSIQGARDEEGGRVRGKVTGTVAEGLGHFDGGGKSAVNLTHQKQPTLLTNQVQTLLGPLSLA